MKSAANIRLVEACMMPILLLHNLRRRATILDKQLAECA